MSQTDDEETLNFYLKNEKYHSLLKQDIPLELLGWKELKFNHEKRNFSRLPGKDLKAVIPTDNKFDIYRLDDILNNPTKYISEESHFSSGTRRRPKSSGGSLERSTSFLESIDQYVSTSQYTDRKAEKPIKIRLSSEGRPLYMQPLKVKEIVKEKEEKQLIKIEAEIKHYKAIVKPYPLKDPKGEEIVYDFHGRVVPVKELVRPESPPKKVANVRPGVKCGLIQSRFEKERCNQLLKEAAASLETVNISTDRRISIADRVYLDRPLSPTAKKRESIANFHVGIPSSFITTPKKIIKN